MNKSFLSLSLKPLSTFLYGTAWKEADTSRCVEDAINAGFRGIDTANQRKHYFEEAVGNAIQKVCSEGKISRKDLFIQTKFTFINGQDHRLPYDSKDSLKNQVRQSFESSCQHLHTDYLDSYVLHGPTTGNGLNSDDYEIWSSMESLHESGKTKLLGVSNVNISQLRELYSNAKIKPSFVQNRCYARRGWDKEIREFCNENKIIYQGFSLLTANPEVFQNPKFLMIQKRIGCTPAQLVFRFSQQIGMLPLTGTTDPEHMKEDLESGNFQLTAEEINTIETISV